jgi:hypothetical protein
MALLGGRFEPSNSDLDIIVEVDWDRRDVLARADLINTLASAKLKLEQGLLILLERADASKPIISLATLAAEP